jgi:hypothetical protein
MLASKSNGGDDSGFSDGLQQQTAPESKAPHPGPLPEGEGTDRGGWTSYADMKYRIESKEAKNRPSTTQHNERKLEYRS